MSRVLFCCLLLPTLGACALAQLPPTPGGANPPAQAAPPAAAPPVAGQPPATDAPPANQPPAAGANPATPPDAAVVPPAPPPEASVAVTRDDIAQLRQLVEAAAALTPEQKQETLATLQAAQDALTRADEFKAAFDSYPAKTAGIEAQRQAEREAVDAAQRQAAAQPPGDADVNQLEQTLTAKQQELLQKRTDLEQVDRDILARTQRQVQIKEELAKVPEDLRNVTQELERLQGVAETDLPARARRLRFLADRRRLEAKPPALQAEAAYLAAHEAATLFTLKRSQLGLHVKRLTDEVEAWRRAALRKKLSDSARRIADAQDLVDTGPEYLRDIHRENLAIAQEETDVRGKISRVESQLAKLTADLEGYSSTLAGLREREARLGSSRAFGIRLREEQHHLPDTRSLTFANRTQLQDYEESLTRAYEWKQSLDELDDLPQEVQRLAASIPMERPASDDDIGREEPAAWQARMEDRVRAALTQKQEYLTHLIAAYAEYNQQLFEIEQKRGDLIATIDTFQEYIRERVLWIPTHRWLDPRQVLGDEAGVRALIDPAEWRDVADVLLQDLSRRPWLYVLAAALWLGMLVTQSRQRAALLDYSKKAVSRLNTSMQPTWSVLFWTLLKSLVMPFPFLFLGAAAAAGLDPEARLLGQSVATIAVWLWWIELVRHVCRTHGLGPDHFQWPQRVCETVRAQLSSLLLISTPILFFVAILNSRAVEGQSDGLERTGGILFLASLGYTLHRLTSRKWGVLREWNERNPGGWQDRLSGLWHLLAISIPAAVAGLIVAGYTYAAEQLSIKLALTLMLVFFIVMTRSLLLRALALRHRRLSVEQARKLRAATSDGAAAPNAQIDAQTVRDNLTEVSLQSRRLLMTTLILVAGVGLWMVWSDVLPALQGLEVPLAEGSTLTYKNLLYAGVLLVVITTAVRNVPGLIEMLLLEQLPLDRSVRYATGALTRYALIVVGILLVSDALRIRWDQVQWLVAALTVGLGFGLQEIFANFVSGLIILFEQPVRVGDVVTLDNVSGTVTRIRMRATTITDWDQKDFVVPNREFITGKLLNWTLTDTVNRITIPVGVSYDADPAAVTELLKNIVASQPHVLSTPAPSVTFDQFGDSALNFTIRLFLPSLDKRMETTHNLHLRIFAALAEAGIEIPFPQRDLHVKTVSGIQGLIPHVAADDLADASASNGSANGANGKHQAPKLVVETAD